MSAPPLIAIRESNGTVIAKEGGLSAQWTTEWTGSVEPQLHHASGGVTEQLRDP